MSKFWNKVEAGIYRGAASVIANEEGALLAVLPAGAAKADDVIAAVEAKLPLYVKLLAAPEIDSIKANLEAQAVTGAKPLLDSFAASLIAQANKIDPPAPSTAGLARASVLHTTPQAPPEDPHRAAAVDAIRNA